MNVTSTFGKLKTKQYELTGKQRLMVLGVIGIIVMLIIYINTSDVDVAVGTNPPNANSQGTGKALNKTEKQDFQAAAAIQSIRDPFALPPQLTGQSNAVGSVPPIPNTALAAVPGMVPKSVVPNIPSGNVKLTGIVGGTGRNLAVIMADNKSKTYGVNEYVGAYKVTAITNEYVILANAESKLILSLEAAGQKGGNNSEK